MLLYSVEPESSRSLCCKVHVYKRIGVVFKWFFPGVFRENNLVKRDKGRVLKCRQRSCLFKGTREVTWISGRGRVYTRVTEVEV